MPCPDSDISFDTKKNLVNKNQGWEPIQQKYKAKENTSRHNLKKKQKKNNQQRSGKDQCFPDILNMNLDRSVFSGYIKYESG
jgi:hypothetical protein